ncbi:MAG: ABC transporter permease [Dehalococcoidia bacterium]|nr:ABC transporter permease [Dehalococcoidia bacterium]
MSIVSPPPSRTVRPARRSSSVIPWLGIAMPGPRSYRVWQRNRDVFFRLWKAESLPPTIEPLVTLLGLGLGLGGYVSLGGDQEYVQFLAPGMLMVFPMFAAMFEALFGSYFRMDQHGTYAAIYATPVRPEEIVLGDIAWAATRMALNTAMVLLILLALTPWMGLIQSPWVVLTIPVGFLVGLLMSGLAIAFTSVARSLSQLSYFFSIFVLPMFWFSGGFFPTDQLPAWATKMAAIFPLYHAVAVSRALTTGVFEWGILGNLLWLVVVTPPALWLGIWAMRRRIIQG